MNLLELTNTIYLAANDFEIGTTFPLLKILSVEKKDAPSGKGQKAVITLEKAPKPWMCSSVTVLREIGLKLGAKNIEKAWLGAYLSLKVVGGVKRPDGTKGNAFRIAEIRPANAKAETTDTNTEGEQA
jgi:hypothetical protein